MNPRPLLPAQDTNRPTGIVPGTIVSIDRFDIVP
jgi:hypothetical protein